MDVLCGCWFLGSRHDRKHKLNWHTDVVGFPKLEFLRKPLELDQYVYPFRVAIGCVSWYVSHHWKIDNLR